MTVDTPPPSFHYVDADGDAENEVNAGDEERTLIAINKLIHSVVEFSCHGAREGAGSANTRHKRGLEYQATGKHRLLKKACPLLDPRERYPWGHSGCPQCSQLNIFFFILN